MNSLDFSLNEQGALWEVLAKECCDLTHILVGPCYGYCGQNKCRAAGIEAARTHVGHLQLSNGDAGGLDQLTVGLF